MPRWSKEEDDNILEALSALDEEPIYSEFVEYHNELFKTERTELAYKARVLKIAKENNIVMNKSKTIWSDEDKELLITTIQKNPFNIDWSALEIKFSKPEINIRNMYNKLIESSEHITLCLEKCSKDVIFDLLKSNMHSCTSCIKTFYSQPKVWQDKEYCDVCYTTNFKDEIIERWEMIKEYSKSNAKDYCNICHMSVEYNNQIGTRFHFDHLNMFEKSDSICNLVRNGSDIEYIFKELEQCQVLCVSCHCLITQIENKCGFTRLKCNITRQYNKDKDEETKIKQEKEYLEKYKTCMSSVYDTLRDITQNYSSSSSSISYSSSSSSVGCHL